MSDADPHVPLPHISTLNQHKEGDNSIHQRILDSGLHQHVLIVVATPLNKDERPGSAALYLDGEGVAILEAVQSRHGDRVKDVSVNNCLRYPALVYLPFISTKIPHLLRKGGPSPSHSRCWLFFSEIKYSSICQPSSICTPLRPPFIFLLPDYNSCFSISSTLVSVPRL